LQGEEKVDSAKGRAETGLELLTSESEFMLVEETGLMVSEVWAMVTKSQELSNGERARCGGD
jgi:hypothetical protein